MVRRRCRATVDLQRQADVVEYGAPGQQRRVLEDVADLLGALRGRGALAGDFARCRPSAQQPADESAGASSCRSRWAR